MQKSLFFLLLSFGLAATAWSADTVPPTTPPDSSAWQDLYAQDLSDTIAPKGVWSFKDGVLSAVKDKELWTKKEYGNYILDLEFKTTPKANSGVLVHCSNIPQWVNHSIEVQLYDSFGDKPNAQGCAAIFGHLAPKKQLVKKPGEWNHMTITCKGGMIYVMLNGEQVTEIDLTKYTSAKKNVDGSEIPPWLSTPLAKLPTKGHIGLQGAHGGHGQTFFRNIKIKPLD